MFRLTIGLLCSAALLTAQDDLDQQLRSIIGAYAIAAENAADPVNSEQALYAGAIPAMLRKLDPHSVFFDPEQFEQLKRMESSTSKGFGSVVSILPGRVIVCRPWPARPPRKRASRRAMKFWPSTATSSGSSIPSNCRSFWSNRASGRRSSTCAVPAFRACYTSP